MMLDEWKRDQGQPGLHALVIGISDYPYLADGSRRGEGNNRSLGLRQLTSAARSAFRVADWLAAAGDRLPLPLVTLRLLTAPSAEERRREPRLTGSAEECTLERVRFALHRWRADAARHRDNITWFYFAGHGVQRNRQDSVLLLSDFNIRYDDVLGRALASKDIYDGMKVAATDELSQIARTQFYFHDACRNLPTVFPDFQDLRTATLWPTRLRDADHRATFSLFSTFGGERAYGNPGEMTVFAEKFLDALNNDAVDCVYLPDGSERWVVRPFRLLEVLKETVSERARELKEQQEVEQGPSDGSNAVLGFSSGPPRVQVRISLAPPEAHPPVELRVEDDASRPGPILVERHPYDLEVPAGSYFVRATFADPRFQFQPRRLPAQAPRKSWVLACSPL